MNNYLYKCFDCGKTYSKEFIEDELIYICPECGTVEKNSPLKGILTVEYDYEEIRRKESRENFLKLLPGKFWLYPYLWPLEFENGIPKNVNEILLNRIALGQNSLLELSFDGNNFLALDDSRNPTLSYKDRASSLVALKALQKGIKKIAAASTGNAGSSIAGIAARLGLKSVVFVPKNIPEAKRIQIQSYGADLFLVDGDYDLAFDLCLEISSQKKWYNRNTGYNPLTLEGKKSSAYDIFISSHGQMPDTIFVPTGDGVIISGIYKGLRELFGLGWIEKIPRLISVQAEGSSALARFVKNGVFEYKPAQSIADSLCAGAPRCLYPAAEAVQKSGGSVVTVNDNEIMNAQEYVALNFGILLEPSSASVFAAYKKMFEAEELKNEKSLLLFTGNGLKDTSALKLWNGEKLLLSSNRLKQQLL